MIKRSNMKFILMNLLDEEAISLEDLEGFSDDSVYGRVMSGICISK